MLNSNNKMKLELIDLALHYCEQNPSQYNPGFPLKVKNRVLCASPKNRVETCGKINDWYVDSKRNMHIESMNRSVLQSFEDADFGTQTDFLGAVILMACQKSLKHYTSLFYTRNSKIAYVRVAQEILCVDTNLTGVFLNSDKLFPNIKVDNIGGAEQDLSPRTVAEVLYQVCKQGRL